MWEDDRNRLVEISEEISNCNNCPLAKQNKGRVAGWIPDKKPRSMIVTDYPTIKESQLQIPLVDAVGERVNPILKEAGISKDDLAILHCLKCSTPHERYPTHHESIACSHIIEQVNILKPDAILLMGKISTNLVLGVDGFVADVDELVEADVIEANRHKTILGSYGEPGHLVAIRITYSPHFKQEIHRGSPESIEEKIRADIIEFAKIHRNVQEIYEQKETV